MVGSIKFLPRQKEIFVLILKILAVSMYVLARVHWYS